MSSPPKIRRYIPADRDATLAIWLEASRVGHGFLGEAELQKQKALVRDHYLDASETWLALDGDTPLGFIGLLDAFIGGLFVAPTAHGRGIGRQLVEHAATLKGALEVEVYAANREALGFYARCGFVESGRRPRDDEGRAGDRPVAPRTLVALTENARRDAAQALEETGEVGRLAEAEAVGDLVHRHRRVDQVALGLQQQALVHDAQCGMPAEAARHAVQVCRGDAQATRVLVDSQVLAEMPLDQLRKGR